MKEERTEKRCEDREEKKEGEGMGRMQKANESRRMRRRRIEGQDGEWKEGGRARRRNERQ